MNFFLSTVRSSSSCNFNLLLIQQDTVDLGGFSQGSVYTLSGALQTVLPLDSIASFHLGDLTIPLPD